MGSVILAASIIIWALGYYPKDVEYSVDYDSQIGAIENNSSLTDEVKEENIQLLEMQKNSEHQEKSYIGQLGHFIEPVIRPLGFDWKIGVSIITGLAAKEIVVSTMGVLYQANVDDEDTATLQENIMKQEFTSGDKAGQKVFNPLTAFALMVFVLIYFPCVAVIAAIKKEGNWKWAVFTMVYTTLLAWIAAYGTVIIGSIFI